LAVVLCVALGGAYLTSWVATRAGLAVSSEMIFEGQWFTPSWDVFPWADCAGMAFFMVAVPLAWGRLRRFGTPEVGTQIDRTAAWSALVGLACAACVYVLRRIFMPAGMQGAYCGKLSILMVYWFVVALAEEATFRSMLQRRLMQTSGIWLALPSASVAFALWHGLGAPAHIVGLRIAAGCGFGLLYWWSGRLFPNVLCHWAVNVAIVA